MRQPWWEWGIWFYHAVVTQANGAGGSIIMDFVPVQGMTMIVMHAMGINSGTNTLDIDRNDEDDVRSVSFVDVASGAGTVGSIPRAYTALTTGRRIDSTSIETRIFRADDRFVIRQEGAGASGDTLTVDLRAFLSSAERPIISKGRSTNQADVTIATPTVDVIR